jgi:hypothetical protein
MGAADATLSEAIDLLDSTWRELRDSVLNDRRLIWIGSGFSRDKFPILDVLLEKLFLSLQQLQDPHNQNCPYFTTAQGIVRDFSDVQDLDLRLPPSGWPPEAKEKLFRQLASRYSEVLDSSVSTAGGAVDLPFGILQLIDTYSDVSVAPDAEHRLLALLMAEGSVKQIVTTNWDALIERAYEALSRGEAPVVIACSEELNSISSSGVVFKVHGCARRSADNPSKYKPFIVATYQQIHRWKEDAQFEAFREKLRTLLRERPSLFVGISGQDFNLQSECVRTACNGSSFEFPPARVAFSGNVGVPQRHILRALHGKYYDIHSNNIDSCASIPLFSKPLFGALYVSLLLQKLTTILQEGESRFPAREHGSFVGSAIDTLRHKLCARYDALDVALRWHSLAEEVPRFVARTMGIYRQQRMPHSDTNYTELHPLNPQAMAGDPNLADLNLHWLCLSLAAVLGVNKPSWSLLVSSDPSGVDGQFEIRSPSGSVAVFILSQDISAIQRLEESGAIDSSAPRKVLCLYPTGAQRNPPRRTPARILPGSQVKTDTREVWLQDLALDNHVSGELIGQLELEIAAASTS